MKFRIFPGLCYKCLDMILGVELRQDIGKWLHLSLAIPWLKNPQVIPLIHKFKILLRIMLLLWKSMKVYHYLLIFMCWNNVEMIGRLTGIELMCTFYTQHGLVWDPPLLDLWSGLLWCLLSIYCNYFFINNWIGLAIPLCMRASLCALLHIASLSVLIWYQSP